MKRINKISISGGAIVLAAIAAASPAFAGQIISGGSPQGGIYFHDYDRNDQHIYKLVYFDIECSGPGDEGGFYSFSCDGGYGDGSDWYSC